ncbi:MAG: hypothetical protein RLZZ67_693 [Candidatus Parcubacteria bacterium]|jgi:hypothetical protein
MSQNKVVFKNQPKLSTFAVQEKFNQKRLLLVPVIENFLSNSQYFTGEITVEFAHTGVSSLVCIVESVKEKAVLKVSLSIAHSAGEARFLNVWRDAGVHTPHVFDSGYFKDLPYVLMEYMAVPTLSETWSYREMIENGTCLEMGRLLRKMHVPKGEGYGMVLDGKGLHKTCREWIDGPDMQKRITYVQENNLLPDVWHLFPKVVDVFIAHAEKENHSSFCHDDFGSSNIFATKPLTIFDPNPRFNNRYTDVGRTIVNYVAKGLFPKEIVDGYFEKEACDEKVLYASIFLNVVMKLPRAQEKGLVDVIKNLQEYLVLNKSVFVVG